MANDSKTPFSDYKSALYQLSYAGERRQKEVTRVTTLRRKRQKGHCNFCSPGRLLKTLVALFADARVSGKRAGRLQIFDHRAEIDRLGIERFVFCDLGPIQHFEPVALEHFFSTAAFECNDLAVNAFFAGAIQITEIRAHERTRCRDFASVRQQIDVKMWRTPRRRRHFAPAMHERPANEPA